MDSESESDGGMQINPTSIADFWDAGDDLESSDPDEHDIDIQSDMDTPLGGWTPQGHREITGDTERYSHRAPDPLTTTYNQSGREDIMQVPTEYEKDARMRSHLRDEKHAALCVLMDRELLVTYALSANETIPQTRRRFMAKYLAPSDAKRADDLYAPRFYIPADGNGGEASLVRARYRDVIGTAEGHGWHKPALLRRAESGSQGGSRSGSAGSLSGGNSPRRVASGVRLASGSGRSSLGARGVRENEEDEDEDL